LTRPEFNKETNECTYKKFDNVKLSQLQNDISSTLGDHFSQQILDQFYSKMVHDEECDYNPYDNLEYYNIQHKNDEEQKAVEQAILE